MRCQRTILPRRHAFPDIFLSRLFDTVPPPHVADHHPLCTPFFSFFFFLTSNTPFISPRNFSFSPSPLSRSCPPRPKKFLISIRRRIYSWNVTLTRSYRPFIPVKFLISIYLWLRWWGKILQQRKKLRQCPIWSEEKLMEEATISNVITSERKFLILSIDLNSSII